MSSLTDHDQVLCIPDLYKTKFRGEASGVEGVWYGSTIRRGGGYAVSLRFAPTTTGLIQQRVRGRSLRRPSADEGMIY